MLKRKEKGNIMNRMKMILETYIHKLESFLILKSLSDENDNISKSLFFYDDAYRNVSIVGTSAKVNKLISSKWLMNSIIKAQYKRDQ